MHGRRTRALAVAWSAAWLLASVPSAQAGPGEPPVPAGTDPGGVAVALIDSGVNYTVPEIAARLARDAQGRLLGYDFHDDDRMPFDIVPGYAASSGNHHGTGVAGVLMREAPAARLVPYRYHATSFESLAQIVRHIGQGPARIVSMPLGGYARRQWEPMRRAIAAHPEILFVVSAGNEGRNVDEKPIYPAAFGLPNVLVVASTDNFGRFPKSSNWGVKTVDISTPGERLKSLDHSGVAREVSGSSYAVPRIAALAARLSARRPDWDAARLKAAIVALAVRSPGERTPRTRHGWIPNPAQAGPLAP